MLFVSCALLLVGVALWLFGTANARATREQASAFVDGHAKAVQSRYQEGQPPLYSAAPTAARYWDDFLARADITPDRRFYLLTCIPAVMLTALALIAGGMLAAVVMLMLYVLGVVFYLWNRSVRTGTRLRLQLPAFLDGMLRMMTIGSSIPSAFQSAATSTEPPLRACLAKVVQLQRAGTDLDQAMFLIARQYRVDELVLIAAVLRMSQRYGGRADIVIERTAAFMRDREQAQRDLMALSSETRLSAWVLGLLPVIIGGIIIVSNPAYVLSMWHDPTGRLLLYCAVGLQVTGAFLLYRLGKSV